MTTLIAAGASIGVRFNASKCTFCHKTFYAGNKNQRHRKRDHFEGFNICLKHKYLRVKIKVKVFLQACKIVTLILAGIFLSIHVYHGNEVQSVIVSF